MHTTHAHHVPVHSSRQEASLFHRLHFQTQILALQHQARCPACSCLFEFKEGGQGVGRVKQQLRNHASHTITHVEDSWTHTPHSRTVDVTHASLSRLPQVVLPSGDCSRAPKPPAAVGDVLDPNPPPEAAVSALPPVTAPNPAVLPNPSVLPNVEVLAAAPPVPESPKMFEEEPKPPPMLPKPPAVALPSLEPQLAPSLPPKALAPALPPNNASKPPAPPEAALAASSAAPVNFSFLAVAAAASAFAGAAALPSFVSWSCMGCEEREKITRWCVLPIKTLYYYPLNCCVR